MTDDTEETGPLPDEELERMAQAIDATARIAGQPTPSKVSERRKDAAITKGIRTSLQERIEQARRAQSQASGGGDKEE